MSQLADAAIREEFGQQLADLATAMEQEILVLEEHDDPDARRCLMGHLHNLKGEAALLGLAPVANLAHAAEGHLERGGAVDAETLLRAVDWWRRAADRLRAGEPLPAGEGLVAALDGAGEGPHPPAADEQPPVPAPTLPAVDVSTADPEELTDFCDEAEEHLSAAEEHLLALDADPGAAEALDAVFRAFHTIKGVAGFSGLTPIQELAHRAEELLDAARRGRLVLQGEPLDLSFRAVDLLKELVQRTRRAMRGDGRLEPPPAASELLARIGACLESAPAGEGVPAAVASAGEAVVAGEEGSPPDTAPTPKASPPAEEEQPSAGGLILLSKGKKKAAAARATSHRRTPARPAPEREAMRVDAARLDRLVNLIGELVIAEAMVTRAATQRDEAPTVLRSHLERVAKISRDLQEIGMSLRMVPVKPLFQKMARLVRDLARKSGRKITLVASGEETEVDKAVVDLLADPLVHLLRNAVDHGVEKDPAERVKAGKPEQAVIELRAYHKSGSLVIEVEDDGRGLDRERILARAVERGLVRPDEQLSDREIDELIFRPGFSTAEQVTEVSGRGVGMDVVRRNIESLRGSVEVDSEPGSGTLFRLRLPLTLAIIEGLLVQVGPEIYVLPALQVERLLHPAPGEIRAVLAEGRLLPVQDRLLPVQDLSAVFGVTADRPEQPVAVVVEAEGRSRVLLVDGVVGRQQIVIKSLGAGLPPVPGVGGAAILSDGRVALILDVASLPRDTQPATGRAETGGTA